jgi:CheY-like chemotaxis protein
MLVLQDADPPFRLAAWVLQEGGYSVRVLSDWPEAPDVSDEALRLVVVNLSLPAPEEETAMTELREMVRELCILHITTDVAHEKRLCPCDAFVSPPFSGEILLQEARRLLPVS